MPSFGSISEFVISDAGASAEIDVTTVVTIAVSAPIPEVSGGCSVDVPASSIVISAPVPEIMQSVNLLIPPGIIAVTAPASEIGSGVTIDVESEISYTANLGGISEGAISEFALTDGASFVVTRLGVPEIRLTAPPSEIVAGKIVDMPATSIQVSALPPEIISRTRKMRVQAIAS